MPQRESNKLRDGIERSENEPLSKTVQALKTALMCRFSRNTLKNLRRPLHYHVENDK